MNEWNPGRTRRGTELDACYITEMICRLHKAPVDMLMYYDGQINGAYQGLFNPLTYDVFPAYYALYAFNELYLLKNEVYCKTEDDFPIIAASNGKIAKILISNITESSINIELLLPINWRMSKCCILDDSNGLKQSEISNPFCVPPEKIMLLEYVKV